MGRVLSRKARFPQTPSAVCVGFTRCTAAERIFIGSISRRLDSAKRVFLCFDLGLQR
jgi:hypothetical protein